MNILRKTLLFCLSLALFSCVFISYAKADSDASLFFDASQKIFNKGDEVVVSVKVKSPSQNINAVTGSFKIPKNFQLESIDDTASILDFWVNEPKVVNKTISFQGVAIKKPYQGAGGLVFSMKGIVTNPGTLLFNFDDGVILADDGLGTNILGQLPSLSLNVKDSIKLAENITKPESIVVNNTNAPALALIIPPVITNAVPPISPLQSFTLQGKGLPNALTKIQFQDVTEPSFGVKFVRSFIKNRVPLSDVEVQNDSSGVFSYVSPSNLVAGVYNAVPEYINPDKAESVIGTGIKVFVQENTLSKILIVIINVLVLIIPITALILLIIFLPWYFIRRLRLMRKKMEFEEEKIDVEEHNLGQNKGQTRKIL